VERHYPYAELSSLRLVKPSSKTSLLARTCGNGARTWPAPQVVRSFYPLGGRQSGLAAVLARGNAQRSRRVAIDPSTRMLEREDL
jgi:hypothetical protein